jgi:hypothetical protein
LTPTGPSSGALAILIVVWLAWTTSAQGVAHTGQVIFGKLPLPGASVTATSDGKEIVTTSEADGTYRFTDLAEGAWTVRVEMLGFGPVFRELALPSPEPVIFEMTLLPFDEIARTAVRPTSSSKGPGASTRNGDSSGRRSMPRGRRRANRRCRLPAAGSVRRQASAADGLLINGSVNNGGLLLRPVGRVRRRGTRSLYNWGSARRSATRRSMRAVFLQRPTDPGRTTPMSRSWARSAGRCGPGLLRNGPTLPWDTSGSTITTPTPVGDHADRRDARGEFHPRSR